MIRTGPTGTFKAPEKLYRIGDIVRHTPFSRQTIHNYTTMGLIEEAEWTQGGHRLYDESVFYRLSRIVELKKTKSLFEIRKVFLTGKKARQAKAKKAGIPKTTNGADTSQGSDNPSDPVSHKD